MRGLTEFEQAVVDKLLAGAHPTLAVLRTQAERARLISREYTGVGFYLDFEVPPDAPTLSSVAAFAFGDVEATIDGLQNGAGFVLFVEGGRLSMLEGYSYDEPWPAEARKFTLSYHQEPRQIPLPEGAG
jgi:hypothetical protein